MGTIKRLSSKEAADYLGYSEETLIKWRHGGDWSESSKGPKFVKCHHRIWYRQDWLDAWMDSVWYPSGKNKNRE